MNARRSSVTWSLGLLVVLAAAACGGGSSPDAQPTPTPLPSPSPTAVREARLWVLAALDDPDPFARPPAVLLYSDDLGASWQSLADSGVAGTTTAFDFVDSDRGVAVGGDVAQRTADGGRTWTTEIDDPSEPPGDHLELAGVQIDATGTAIMLGNVVDDAVLSASSYESFRLPADGSPAERKTVDAAPLARIGSMCTTARGVGIGVGGFRFSMALQAYSTTLGTRDAGASWRLWDTISGGVLTWSGTACAGEQDLWRFGFAFSALDPSSGFVIDHSEDGGRTWDGPVDRDAIGDGSLAAASFTDRSTGWFAGGRGAAPLILHTVDAGATLAAQPIPAGVTGGLGTIAFANERVGLAAGATVIDASTGRTAALALVTRDGGGTWTVAGLPAGLSNVLDGDATP